LRKGYGLCHGTAGNGYVFLNLYRATNDLKWLHRTIKVFYTRFFFQQQEKSLKVVLVFGILFGFS